MTPYERAIRRIGSEAKAATLLGYKTAWGLARHKGVVPAEKVIHLCKAAGWEALPHELRPDLYPNPEDGLPADKRVLGMLHGFGSVLTEAERATIINAVQVGPEATVAALESVDVAMNVRVRLLEAARRSMEEAA